MKFQYDSFCIKHLFVPTSDGLQLPALHYSKPSNQINKQLLVYIHGAGSSSILRIPNILNTLADKLISANIDMLAFNNRGAGYITKFDTIEGQTVTVGMSYEKISESTIDIEAALSWAKKNNYTEIYLYGHSTGANKLVLWSNNNSSSKNVKGLILSAGGDDVSLQLSRYSTGLLKKLEKFMKNAAYDQLVPNELFPGDHPISVGSLNELITPGSDYDIFPFNRPDHKKSFKYLESVKYPISVIYGSDDFGTMIPAESAIKLLQSKKTLIAHIIPNADHNFTDKENELSETILDCTVSK